MGLVDLNFVAIDGTKIKASANGAHANAIVAKDLEIAVAALEAQIEEYLKDVQTAGDQACAQLPEGLTQRQSLRDAMARDLKELRELGASRLSPVDPDTRPMKTKEGLRLSYNAQAAVDSLNGIIVACDVSQDANDKCLLGPMISEVEQITGMQPDLSAADSGYFSAAQMALAEEAGRAVEVSTYGHHPCEDQPFHSWLFEHDEQTTI